MGGSFQWPSVHDVLSYRDKVRGVMDGVIDNTPLQLPVTHDSPWVSECMECVMFEQFSSKNSDHQTTYMQLRASSVSVGIIIARASLVESACALA